MKEDFIMHVSDGGPVSAFCGFFDVVFKGSAENPADEAVVLTTAPDPTGARREHHQGGWCMHLWRVLVSNQGEGS